MGWLQQLRMNLVYSNPCHSLYIKVHVVWQMPLKPSPTAIHPSLKLAISWAKIMSYTARDKDPKALKSHPMYTTRCGDSNSWWLTVRAAAKLCAIGAVVHCTLKTQGVGCPRTGRAERLQPLQGNRTQAMPCKDFRSPAYVRAGKSVDSQCSCSST